MPPYEPINKILSGEQDISASDTGPEPTPKKTGYSPLVDSWRTTFPGAYDDMEDADLEAAIKNTYPGAYKGMYRADQPGLLGKLWNKMGESFAPPESPEQLAIQAKFRKSHPYVSIPIDLTNEFIQSMTTPKGIGIAAATALAPEVAGLNIPFAGAAAKAMTLPGTLAAGQMAYGGGKNVYEALTDPNATLEETGPKVARGLTEAALGGLGTYGGLQEYGSVGRTAAVARAARAAREPKWYPNKPNEVGQYGDTGVQFGPTGLPRGVNTGRMHGPWPASPMDPTLNAIINPKVRGLLPPKSDIDFVAGPGGTAEPAVTYNIFGDRPANAPEVPELSEGGYPGGYLARRGLPYGRMYPNAEDMWRINAGAEPAPTDTGTQFGPYQTAPTDTGVQHGPYEIPPTLGHTLPEGEDTISEQQRLMDLNAETRPSTGIYERVPTTEPTPVPTKSSVIDAILERFKQEGIGKIGQGIVDRFIKEQKGEMDPEAWLDIIRKITPDEETAQRIFRSVRPVLVAGQQTGKYEPITELGDLPNEPTYARSKAGGLTIGMNVRRGATNLTKDYSSPLPGIMVRESLQNAIDAVKKLTGGAGDVTVQAHKLPGAADFHGFTVTDNGPGLTKAELETKLTDLFETGKEGEEGAGGGKGIGSASYILGGKNTEIETVAQDGPVKKRLVYSGTPDEFFDPEIGVLPKVEEVVPGSTPTGTRVTTTFTDAQSKQHDFAATQMAENIANFSRDIPGNFRFLREPGVRGNPPREVHNGPFRSSADDKLVGSFENKKNKVDISIPKNSTAVKDADSTLVHYLNNGMYQFSENHMVGGKADTLPSDVLVNIQPGVDDLHEDYPFTNTREHLKNDIGAMIEKALDNSITGPAKSRRANRTQELYDSMSDVSSGVVTSRPTVLFDPGDRLTPDELNAVKDNPVIKKLMESYDYLVDGIINASNHTDWADRLEKTGIVLGPTATEKGAFNAIHIPNPKTGKSAILFNPFLRWDDPTLSPYESAIANVVTAMHEVAHIGSKIGSAAIPRADFLADPRFGDYSKYLWEQQRHADVGYENTGHGTGFLTRLAEVFATYGPDRFFNAGNELHGIISDPNTAGYNPEIQNLLQIYNESRGRPATTEDLLSPTGVKQRASEPGGPGTVNWIDQTNAEGATSKPTATNDTAKLARESQLANAAADKLLSTLAGGGRAYQSIEDLTTGLQNRGRILESNDIRDLMKGITNSDLKPMEQANAKLAIARVLNGDTPYASDMNLLRRAYGDNFADQLIALKGQKRFDYPTIRNRVADAVNTTKALMASLNLHAPLRQGLPLLGTRAYTNAFGEMFKMYGDKAVYDGVMRAIESHPYYDLARDSGLALTDLTEDLSRREEEFFSKTAEKLPWVGAASRAYSGFLNKLRMDTFVDMVDQMREQGVATPDSLKSAAEFVNNATGRGSLGRFEKNAVELNTLFFSPRTIASRMRMYNLLNPMDMGSVFRETNPVVRQAKIRAILTMGAWTLGMVTAAKMAGADVSSDPTSSDFGKIRMKNMRIDPYGGFQQYAVFGARLLSGLAQGQNVMPTVGRFTENKLSPVAAFITDMMLGNSAYKPDRLGAAGADWLKEQTGNKYIGSAATARAVNDLLPMTLNDLYEVAKDDPDLLPIALVPAALGATVTDYQSVATSPRGFSIVPPRTPRAIR